MSGEREEGLHEGIRWCIGDKTTKSSFEVRFDINPNHKNRFKMERDTRVA